MPVLLSSFARVKIQGDILVCIYIPLQWQLIVLSTKSVLHWNSRKFGSVRLIDDFRGACAVKGNVQVAGRTSSVSTTEMLSTHDVTLRNVDGSLFHVQIWFVMGHQDQNGQNWRNISQFTMWLSRSSVDVYQTYQSLYQFQHFAAKCDSAMDKRCLPQ